MIDRPPEGATAPITASEEQLGRLIEAAVEKAVQRAFHDLGIRSDELEHIDQAREDFRFVRKMRQAYESAAGKIGGTVIMMLAAGVLGIVWLGLQLSITAKTGAPPR